MTSQYLVNDFAFISIRDVWSLESNQVNSMRLAQAISSSSPVPSFHRFIMSELGDERNLPSDMCLEHTSNTGTKKKSGGETMI